MSDETTSETVAIDPPHPLPPIDDLDTKLTVAATIADAMTCYDLAVNPVVERLQGGPVFTFGHARLLANAIRQGVAAAFVHLADPQPLAAAPEPQDALAEQVAVQRAEQTGEVLAPAAAEEVRPEGAPWVPMS